MTTTPDSPTSSAPAASREPVVESPAPRQEVDLSDLQAEADAIAAKAAEDEVFTDIEKGKKPKDPDDSAEEAETTDADEAEEADAGKDEEEEGEADDDEKAEPKKRSRADRYRDQIARLENENAQLRSRDGGRQLTKTQINEYVESVIGPEPQENDFEDYLTFESERTAWRLDKRQMARQVEASIATSQKERAQRMTENVESHQERVDAFRSRNGEESEKEFDATMAKARNLRVAPAVEELILESGNSAHLQYFFARNPQRLDKINRMSERNAAREIGHIEARLTLPKAKTITTAPKPPRTPSGGAAPRSQEAELTGWLTRKYGKQA